MNKKLILAIAALMIVALTVVAFAYTRTTADNKAAMTCCCHSDSCPMKSQQTASTGEKASCCDNCDCCKGGKMAGMDGDSCPMHKNAEKTAATASDKTGAKTSCDCPCCNHNKETAAAPAV